MTDIRPFISFLETPPLWMDTQFGITQFIFPIVDLKQFLPKSFPSKIRLGHQMEHVCHQLLSQSANYQILLHNLPVKDENRTIGEIDFLLQHKLSKELIHVELTYKFYLVDIAIPEVVHQLIGPNRKDTFFNKMEKMKYKQFPLLHTTEAIKALKAHHINHETVLHQACFKAQLFIPYESVRINITPLNGDCIVGFWINFQQFNTTKLSSFQYYIPSKSAWAQTPNNNVPWKSHQEIIPEISLKLQAALAPMIWIKKSEYNFEKCFVVWR